MQHRCATFPLHVQTVQYSEQISPNGKTFHYTEQFFDFWKTFQYNEQKEVRQMILREHYISQIRPFYDSDLIKIITGIRRSGKSVILSQIKEELEQAGRQVLSLNFENTRLLREIPDADSLISYVLARRKEGKCYVFLDEVQLVKDWNLACRTLRLEDISLFVTGSNSKLLSKEFTKELSGRYVAFCIRPFVYKEIAAYAKELGEEAPISEYLIYGGFPKRLEFREKEAMLRYLEDLHQTIVLNDIMNRYQIRKVEVFRRLVEYIMVSNGRIFSANSISKYLRSQKVQISVNTVMKYLGYLEEAYAIRQVSQYSLKAKKKLDFFEKLYDEDVAFNTIHQPFGRYDVTHNLENVVYNELIYMGYEVYVYNNRGQEIDFIAAKGQREYLIQVAYTVAEEKAYDREMGAFAGLDNAREKILITNDDFDYSTSTVRHVKLKDFLLMQSLDEK